MSEENTNIIQENEASESPAAEAAESTEPVAAEMTEIVHIAMTAKRR